MKDARRKKIRQYRRMLYTDYGTSLHRICDRENEAYHIKYIFKGGFDDNEWNQRKDSLRKMAGVKTLRPANWNAPANFRRDRNRDLRAKQKEALTRAFLNDDWDNFVLPRGRRDAAWLYW